MGIILFKTLKYYILKLIVLWTNFSPCINTLLYAMNWSCGRMHTCTTKPWQFSSALNATCLEYKCRLSLVEREGLNFNLTDLYKCSINKYSIFSFIYERMKCLLVASYIHHAFICIISRQVYLERLVFKKQSCMVMSMGSPHHSLKLFVFT